MWLSVVALSNMDAFRDIPDSVFRNDGLWRQWYDQEAPEMAKVRSMVYLGGRVSGVKQCTGCESRCGGAHGGI